MAVLKVSVSAGRSLLATDYWLLRPVHAAARGEEEAAAQGLVADGVGRLVQLPGAAERVLLAFEPLVLGQAQARALFVDGLRVDAELDEGDERLAEQRVDAEQELRADPFELFAPGRVGHGDDERLAVEAEGDGAAAQRLARRAPPRRERRGLQDLLRLARRAQELRQRLKQIVHF